MTGKELEKIKNSLPKYENGKPPVLTKEQKQLEKEILCVEMINSILIYNGKYNIINNEYMQEYIKELGIDTVNRLIAEQIKDFDKATVLKNVHVDYEGVSYNSIIWADEQ